ncbi:hypothetical protein acsn021_34460 [Anaerocolumna cellulosilytica]|uniref:Uncharacterized protein n=1 Tax=Anaerocolumna cellulosilytica TaxID=433286 RepID=A0A6S6R791_9FIRM|nr:hypothetical protein acsn021_34460 [Anaerocolumna cellulosilytica]
MYTIVYYSQKSPRYEFLKIQPKYTPCREDLTIHKIIGKTPKYLVVPSFRIYNIYCTIKFTDITFM